MNNDFLITRFMFPLDMNARTKFFGGIYFDNPRNEDEIKSVANYLKETNLRTILPFSDAHGQVPSGCVTLMWIYKKFCEKNRKDPLVLQTSRMNKGRKNIYEKLATMWVIVRSNKILFEEDTYGKYTIKKQENSHVLLIDNNPNLNNSQYNRRVINDYFAFFTFLMASDIHSNILLPERYDVSENSLFTTLLVSVTNDSDKFEYPFSNFDRIEKRILEIVESVDKRFGEKKFLFLCKRINLIFEVYRTDKEMCFMEIMALIEMLIAHNPDSNRFNVEDSITRQFINKLVLILYENSNSIDLNELKKELQYAYKIRSAIAHGDFTGFENARNELFKFFKMDSKKKGFEFENQESALDKLIGNALYWLKVLIDLYLSDEQRLILIKNM